MPYIGCQMLLCAIQLLRNADITTCQRKNRMSLGPSLKFIFCGACKTSGSLGCCILYLDAEGGCRRVTTTCCEQADVSICIYTRLLMPALSWTSNDTVKGVAVLKNDSIAVVREADASWCSEMQQVGFQFKLHATKCRQGYNMQWSGCRSCQYKCTWPLMSCDAPDSRATTSISVCRQQK